MRRAAAVLCALWSAPSLADELAVVAVSPPPQALSGARAGPISVTFDRPVDAAGVSRASFWAFARWGGVVEGRRSVSADGLTITLTPDRSLSAGEQVMVILSHDLAGADGSPMRPGGYSWQFWTCAGRSDMVYATIASMTTRTTPGQSSRAYGGVATDLNHDGFLDLTIVNEDTADLRVFMNLADGTGQFAPFAQPTYPVGVQASPSEPADFNRDGHPDICVANIAVSSVSILLGDGEGGYLPQQKVVVAASPRGIAVLDADGDGDLDIVNTNAGPGNLSLLLNDGSGVFGAPVFFDTTGQDEWALAAADMDGDGLLDLVIGSQDDQRIIVARGNGDGTFTQVSSTAAGGRVWMLVTGDVNGDGHADVACGNSLSNRGSILLGNGDGTLGPATTYNADPFVLATDLGDLDGDGDLDWVLSSFSGDWFVFRNDGAGAFSFHQELNAPQAASCSLMLDFDNDTDLDLALVDELADLVILARAEGSPCAADCSGDGVVNIFDFLCFQGLVTTGSPEADCNGDGSINIFDFLCFQGKVTEGCP